MDFLTITETKFMSHANTQIYYKRKQENSFFSTILVFRHSIRDGNTWPRLLAQQGCHAYKKNNHTEEHH